MSRLERHHFAWLSIAAALATIALKTLAWWITGSVGLLSDALESFVNLAGASFALWMILVTREPADRGHPFGHGKAEYFSSGFEGILILGAAFAIIWAAAERLAAPQPIESPGWGLAWSAAATAINFVVARVPGVFRVFGSPSFGNLSSSYRGLQEFWLCSNGSETVLDRGETVSAEPPQMRAFLRRFPEPRKSLILLGLCRIRGIVLSGTL